MSVKAQTPADGVFIAVVGGLWAHGLSGQEGLAGEDAANRGPKPTSELHSVGNLGAYEWTSCH